MHHGLTIPETTPEHTTHSLRYRAQRQRPRSDDAAALKRLLDLLCHAGALAEHAVPLAKTPAQQCTDAFGLYLRQERARAPTTVTYYLEFVSRFLRDRFAGGPVALAALDAADVIGFVQRQAASRQPMRAQLLTTARRSFLHDARDRGDLSLDLAAAVPTVAPWSMASLPRSLPPEHVELVLAPCHRQTAIGRRDDAMLLRLARRGLRAGAVVSLRLEDIDWDAGCITVRGKGGHWAQRPLPIEVGEALATSLQQGRPACSSRRVFMRQKAPLVGFANSIAICTLVARALRRTGVDAPHKGAHLFRHTLATAMLRPWSLLGRDRGTVAPSESSDHCHLCQGGPRGVTHPGGPLAGRCAMNTLRDAVGEYLALRRSVGCTLRDAGIGLVDFVSFLEQQGAASITTTWALAWAQQPASARPAAWARRLSSVRGFARSRSATDARTEIPPGGLLLHRPERARPSLSTDAEMQPLLEAALHLAPAGGWRAWTSHALLGLLAVTG